MPIRAFERLCVFPGTRLRKASPHAVPPANTIVLTRGEPAVEAWLMLPERTTPDGQPEGAPLVVFTHGNAELIDDWGRALQPYRDAGFAVLLPEYRGFGRSAGKPSEKAVSHDVLEFIEQATERPGVDSSRVILHGRSIGGGVACAVLRGFSPSGLILQSTFTSLHDVARRWGVPGALIENRFDNTGAVRGFGGPLLIMHGTRDRLIPVSHAHRLCEVVPHAERALYPVGHNEFPMADSYWDTVLAFATRSVASPSRR